MKTAVNNNNGLMTEGSIFQKILFFSIPLILGNLLQQLYNTADSVMVGNFVGSNALAAVGASSSMIYLLIAFSQGAAVGAGVIVAQYLGAGNKKSVSDAVHTSLVIAGILGIVLTIAGIVLSRQLLEWMKTPEEVMEQAVTYFRLYSAGMFFGIIYNMAAGILNAAGNSKRSLLYLAVASFTNIVLDILFIAILDMGVAGAAIATDISQAVSCILSMAFLMRVKDSYQVSLKKLKIHRRIAGSMIRVGLPTGIQNMVISLSNVLVQTSVNGFGAAAMAGYTAYLKVDGFNILPVMSFSMAVTTFAGQNYGAGNYDRVKKGMYVTLAMGFVYTVLTGALLLTFDDQIMGMFSRDAEVITCGKLAMKYFCPFYFILSILHGLSGALRGVGKSIPPMVVLLLSLCVFRIFWIWLVLPHFSTIEGVYLLYPVSWALGAVMIIIYACTAKWLPAGRQQGKVR